MARKKHNAKAALRQRIEDIYTGAMGERLHIDDCYPTAEQLESIIRALKEAFGTKHDHWHVYREWELGHFQNPETATEWLWSWGCRASKVLVPEEVE